jgi:hypothetical protein
MMFNASPAALWLAAALAIAAAAALGALEWGRPDRRHRVVRVGAAVFATFALALLGLHPAWLGTRKTSAGSGRITAAIWTAGQSPADVRTGADLQYRIALPGVAAVPAGATVYPDVATVRRRLPQISNVDVLGDGLDSGDLEALRGLRVAFHPPDRNMSPASAAVCFVHFPRRLPLGEPLIVEGEVGGLTPGSSQALALDAPDGTTTGAVAGPADTSGKAFFSLRANPPAAIGKFLWRLRLAASSGLVDPADKGAAIGIAVVSPTLPRVLVLESSPHFDTADLRHWFAAAGGKLIARTLVGRDRYRFAASTPEPAPEFSTIDARLLAGIDLLIADPAALATLTPPERDALLAAVSDAGLGILTLPDQAPPPDPPTSLFPWHLTSSSDASQDDGEHLARPAWPGQTQSSAEAIPVSPFQFEPQAEQAQLINDGQGRTLAAALPRGRGQIALTLLHDSGRWLRANDSGAFSAYWSFLFSRLARPLGGDQPDNGRWSLADTDGGPVFAGQPLSLVWSGGALPDNSAQVRAESDAPQDGARIALAPDPAEPSRWRGTFWPRHPGWYQVSASPGASGPALDFFVDEASNWPSLVAERRRSATMRFAQASSSEIAPGIAASPRKGDKVIPEVCFFLLFLAGAGYLWTERRLIT